MFDIPVHQYNAVIEPYVSFLRKKKTEPVDYLMGLFKTYDVVILCERAHPETTQWDMIYQLTHDPQFIQDVGVIFTEYGAVTLQPRLDELLTEPKSTQEQTDQMLLDIYHNLSHWPLWPNTNFYNYLQKVSALNKTLPTHRKIRLFFSDVPWDWAHITTHQQLAEACEQLKVRDRIMAERIIQERNRRITAGERHKCLVIMNFRHAFRPVKPIKGSVTDNAGSHLFKAFPGRVANVLINTVRPVAVRSDSDVDLDLIHEGKWDASFQVVGNPECGFDFANSPFGVDSFDLYRFEDPVYWALRYDEMFTGFVFYKPLDEHRWGFGIPNLIDRAFHEELHRRYAVPEAGSELAKRYEPTDFERDVDWAVARDIPWEVISSFTEIKPFDIPTRFKMEIARWLVVGKP